MSDLWPALRGFGIFLAVSVVLSLLIIWASAGFWPFSSLRGWAEAHLDLARGHYRTLGYGLPPAGMPTYVEILHQRYGVEYSAVAGCTPGPADIAYVAAYDRVSAAAIRRRFGNDIFKKVAAEAFHAPPSVAASREEMHPAK